jgi:hypothetical protein
MNSRASWILVSSHSERLVQQIFWSLPNKEEDFNFVMKGEGDLDLSQPKSTGVRLDSLMAVDSSKWYMLILSVDVSALEIRSSGMINGLGEVC